MTDYKHAACKRELAVIDPYAVVAALEIKSIATPHVGRVDVGDGDSLDNDVASAGFDLQPFPLITPVPLTPRMDLLLPTTKGDSPAAS